MNNIRQRVCYQEGRRVAGEGRVIAIPQRALCVRAYETAAQCSMEAVASAVDVARLQHNIGDIR